MSDPCPAFTVVVPLFNTERYIQATLESIRAQTFGDYEVVVVDDASTDGGPGIVREAMANDARIRMVTQDNRGLAGARNTGIRAARGRYVALLDADDLWLPRKLELHFAHLEANPEVGVSFAPSQFIDESGHDMALKQWPRLAGIDARHIFCRNPVGNGSAAVLRRAALDDVAFAIEAPEGQRVCWFDESFRQSEDIELWIRMAVTTGWRFEGIGEVLTRYRVNTGGLSADVERQLASWYRVRDKIAQVAPHFIAANGRRAEGYQLRYLARRAAMNGAGATALRLVANGLKANPAMLAEEPVRTFATLAFAALAASLPPRHFGAFKNFAFAAGQAPSPAA